VYPQRAQVISELRSQSRRFMFLGERVRFFLANILAPLGMERSFFEKNDVDADRDAATP
jgi:hypothetical protein